MTTILPDPMTPEQRSAYNEARCFADEHGERHAEWVLRLQHSILHARFMNAIKPLVDMKVRVELMDLDARVTLVLKDGLLERQDTEPSPQAKKALAALDELIAAERVRFFGPKPTAPHNLEA